MLWTLVMWKMFLSIYKLIWSTVVRFKQRYFQQVPQDYSLCGVFRRSELCSLLFPGLC